MELLQREFDRGRMVRVKNHRNRTTNYLRSSIGQGRGRVVLNEIRQNSSFGAVKGIVSLVYRVPNGGRHPVLAAPRMTGKSLLSIGPYRALSLLLELEWAVCQLEHWKAVVSNFVLLTDRLQEAILRADWLEAKSTVIALDEKHGLSGWLIVAKTAILQWSEGQESQKAFAGQVMKEYSGLPLGIAHLCSQRSEDAVSESGYLARAEKTIRAWGLDGSWNAYVRWVALGSTPAVDDDACALLRVAATGTIFDLFEATVAAAAHAVSEASGLQEKDRARLTGQIERLLVFGDRRIASLGKSLGLSSGVNPSPQLPILFRDVVTSSLSEAAPHGFLGALAENLFSVSNRTDAARTSLQALKKLGLMFGFLPLGKMIAAYADAVVACGVFRYEATAIELGRLGGEQDAPIWSVGLWAIEQLVRQLDGLSRSENYQAARQVCEELPQHGVFFEVLAAKARFAIAMQLEDWWGATEVAAETLVRFPEAAHEFPLADVLAEKTWPNIKLHAHRPELSVALAFAIREADTDSAREKLHRHLQQCAVRVLRSFGCANYWELAEFAAGDEQMKCFLREACIESVMEVNTSIRSSRALSEERMRICQELSVLDEPNAAKYLNEIKQITFGLELEEGVRHFDSSRLFVNIDALKKWANTNLSEDFSRYLALRGSALPDAAEIKAALVAVQLDSASEIPRILLEQPKTEADRLLTEIVQKLSREFYTSPVFGLNSFLSLRIRHGSLAGHLRGPLEELGVIASREAEGYAPIERWSAIKAELKYDDAVSFDKVFDNLSADVDEKIGYLVNERLQICSELKPRGAFDDSAPLVLVNALKGGLEATSTVADLSDICVANFKASLEPTLDAIRNEIGEVLKTELDSILLKAMVRLELLSADRMVPVLDALGRARTNLAIAIDRVTQWFRPLDKEASDRTYSLEQIVRMGEKLTTNARPTFEPAVELKIEEGIPRLGAQSGAFLVADALFIVFDNVYLHSGLENPVPIFVEVSINKEGFLAFRIENEVAHFSDLGERLEKLERIRAQLRSGEFRKKVAGEGGTGFFKLRRLGEAAAFEGRSNIEFALSGDRFVVNLRVPLMLREI